MTITHNYNKTELLNITNYLNTSLTLLINTKSCSLIMLNTIFMFVSYTEYYRANYIHSLFSSICDIYCSIHIIELLLLMVCLN